MHSGVVRHINNVVCGEPIDGMHAGFHRKLIARMKNGHARKAVSVGCGDGQKEIGLVRSGLVDEFHLYEISSVRIEAGRKAAANFGLSDRVHFHPEDAFEVCSDTDFDLVYWNNALHHMMDTREAVEWSFDRLADDGLFAMDDFVGPSRFQWSDRMIEYGELVRSWLPDEHFIHPNDPTETFQRRIQRPTIAAMIATDPSEAADSSNIIPSIQAVFPFTSIQLTGGVIYHVGLNDVLSNLDDERDAAYLFSVLAIDRALTEIGDTHYAVAFAKK